MKIPRDIRYVFWAVALVTITDWFIRDEIKLRGYVAMIALLLVSLRFYYLWRTEKIKNK